MIEEMSFKCLLDCFRQYCQEMYLEPKSKVYSEVFFAKIIKYFQLLTIFAKEAPSQVFEEALNRLWAIMSDAYLEQSQKFMVECFCENS